MGVPLPPWVTSIFVYEYGYGCVYDYGYGYDYDLGFGYGSRYGQGCDSGYQYIIYVNFMNMAMAMGMTMVMTMTIATLWTGCNYSTDYDNGFKAVYSYGHGHGYSNGYHCVYECGYVHVSYVALVTIIALTMAIAMVMAMIMVWPWLNSGYVNDYLGGLYVMVCTACSIDMPVHPWLALLAYALYIYQAIP